MHCVSEQPGLRLSPTSAKITGNDSSSFQKTRMQSWERGADGAGKLGRFNETVCWAKQAQKKSFELNGPRCRGGNGVWKRMSTHLARNLAQL